MKSTSLNVDELKSFTVNSAYRAGFVCAGIAAAGEIAHSDTLKNWLDSDMNANMSYLADRREMYCNVTKNFEWAKSILCLGAYYGGGIEPKYGELFAMYARGRDYHKILFKAASSVAAELEQFAPGIKCRVCVDTAPVPERHLAADAGLGWIGRSGMLINDTYGTRLLLAEIVLDVDLPPDLPVSNNCLQCRRCQHACPNSAIVDFAVVDARRCNSWATIENKGAIDPEKLDTSGYVFGCDRCANACPYNRRAADISPEDNPLTTELQSHSKIAAMSLPEILQLSYEQWDLATRGTAVRRCGYEGLLRNAAIAASWHKDSVCADLLEKLTRNPSEIISAAAVWSLDKLRGS